MFSLIGRTVVVTGGGRGIGRGITLAMAQAGANVVLAGRTLAHLENTASEVRSAGQGEMVAIVTDITRKAGIENLVAATLARFGGIHAWVNNAGSASPNDIGPLLDIDEGQWDRVVDLNLKWSFFACQAAARAMKNGGSIINISSRSGSQPCPMTGQYGAAKAGIENLTATMAVEWGHLGIRVNAIAPGVIPAETSSMLKPSTLRRQIETIPLRRLGRVEAIGPLAVYFASDESSWVTGTVVQVTGGSRIPVGLLSYLHRVNARMEADETQAAANPAPD